MGPSLIVVVDALFTTAKKDSMHEAIAAIQQAMLSHLDNAQMRQLCTVLEHVLGQYELKPRDGKGSAELVPSNDELLKLFLDAKDLEGCSARTIRYYRITITRFPAATRKGSKERIMYFDARTKIHLRSYLASRSDETPALFVSLDAPHERLQVSGVEGRLRELGRRLGIGRVHPHKFRRTLATRAIDRGMPIEQVQRLLGHSKIDTTLMYAMVDQSNVKASHGKYIA